jgi:hypothetical protein
LSGGFSLPQAAHRHGSGDPQSPQNFLPFEASAPQRGQIMRPPCRAVMSISNFVCRAAPTKTQEPAAAQWQSVRRLLLRLYSWSAHGAVQRSLLTAWRFQ